MTDKVGILAGGGTLPQRIAETCVKDNIPYFVVGFKGFVDKDWIKNHPHKIIRLGAAGALLKELKKNAVERVVLAGHIRRPSWNEIIPDFKGALMLRKLRKHVHGDNALLTFLAAELNAHGFAVIGTQDIYADGLTPHGTHTVTAPNDDHWKDIARAVLIARHLGSADIGQAVVIQNGLILGVEAIEGTDELINRCAGYKREGSKPILIKTKKPQQDDRLDLPTIGSKTIQTAMDAGFGGIAIEADKTLFLERDTAIDLANNADLFITGFNNEDLKK